METPGAVIRMGSPAITYSTSMGGTSHDYTFSILLLHSLADGGVAQDALDGYLDVSGADSVYAAVGAAPTLGGVCDAATVTSVANAGPVAWHGVEYLGAEFLVSVLA